MYQNLKIMKNQLISVVTFLLVSLLFHPVDGNGQALQLVADRQYDLGYYDAAREIYTDLSSKGELSLEGYLKLGNALLILNDPYQAESYLSIGSRRDVENQFEEFNLLLGRAAMMQGNYESAREYFMSYSEYDPLVGGQFARKAGNAGHILENDKKVRISNMPWNTPGAEIGVAFFKDQLFFTSVSPKDFSDCPGWECSTNGILVHTNENDHFSPKGPVRSELKRSEAIGMVTYCADGNRVAFVRGTPSLQASKLRAESNELSIYIAVADENGDWKESISFPYNAVHHSNGFPHLNEDGTVLYFASNRDGGFGGYDLYKSDFSNGKWMEPENLGPEINSPGNEISPFVVGETILFSSDWHQGMGGYDVFYTNLYNPGLIENAGRGINSTRDDYGLIATPDLKSGFFISNRPAGRGLEDVFSFSAELPITESEELIPLASELDGGDDKEHSVTQVTGNSQDNELIVIDRRTKYNPMVIFASNTEHSIRTSNSKIRDVYTVQVASLRESFDEQFFAKMLGDIGDVFKVFFNNDIKIRVGNYESRENASQALSVVKERGFEDAFIVLEQIVVNPAKGGYSNESVEQDKKISRVTPNLTISNYLVRLGAFRNTRFFDEEKWSDFQLVKEKNGDFTIFLLGTFTKIEEAEEARIHAVKNGFSDAYILVEYNGERRKF